jgi:hypothetical protein
MPGGPIPTAHQGAVEDIKDPRAVVELLMNANLLEMNIPKPSL